MPGSRSFPPEPPFLPCRRNSSHHAVHAFGGHLRSLPLKMSPSPEATPPSPSFWHTLLQGLFLGQVKETSWGVSVLLVPRPGGVPRAAIPRPGRRGRRSGRLRVTKSPEVAPAGACLPCSPSGLPVCHGRGRPLPRCLGEPVGHRRFSPERPETLGHLSPVPSLQRDENRRKHGEGRRERQCPAPQSTGLGGLAPQPGPPQCPWRGPPASGRFLPARWLSPTRRCWSVNLVVPPALLLWVSRI